MWEIVFRDFFYLVIILMTCNKYSQILSHFFYLVIILMTCNKYSQKHRQLEMLFCCVLFCYL